MIIEHAGVRAVAQSDALMGYGSRIGPGWRLLSRMRWSVCWGQHGTHIEVTHSVVNGAESVLIVPFYVAGIYSGPGERELPGSGDNRTPEQAVREFIEQLSVVVALERTVLAQPRSRAVVGKRQIEAMVRDALVRSSIVISASTTNSPIVIRYRRGAT